MQCFVKESYKAKRLTLARPRFRPVCSLGQKQTVTEMSVILTQEEIERLRWPTSIPVGSKEVV